MIANKKYQSKLRTLVLSGLLAVASAFGGCADIKPKPFVKADAYYDTRGKPTSSLVANISDLPLGTNFFGFADFERDPVNGDIKPPYSEMKISKKLENGLGVALEYDRDFNVPEGIVRKGFIYEPDVSKFIKDAFIGINFYPLSNPDKGSQIGVYGKKDFNNKDMYVEGFLDYDFDTNKVVSEVQFGKKLKDKLYGVIEGRYNGYSDENFGVGIGLEYNF